MSAAEAPAASATERAALDRPTELVDNLPEGLRSTKKEAAQRPPPDATQPFDPSLLPFLLAKPPTDATQPLDLSLLPAVPTAQTQPIDSALIPAALKAFSAKSGAVGEAPRPEHASTQPLKPVDATMPLDSSLLPSAPRNPDHAPTQALSAADLPLGPRNVDNAATQALDASMLPQPPSLFASSRSSRGTRQSSALWLVVLTAGGLVVGTGGGYALLQHVRHRTVEYATGNGPPATSSPTVAPPPPRLDDKSVLVAAGTSEGCPPGMRRVDAGPFMMGTAHDDPMRGFDERALGSVEVSRFCIDDFEYPNRPGQKPMVSVSWADAENLCTAEGKRLCTEQEWEKACKGPDNARFPYGEKFDAKACNTEDPSGEERELAASGKFGRCQSGFGLFDLSGNVAEWTATPFASGNDKTQKGGSYDRPDYAARCSARRSGPPGSRSPQVGFRCCASAR